jgi:spore germination protein GerM
MLKNNHKKRTAYIILALFILAAITSIIFLIKKTDLHQWPKNNFSANGQSASTTAVNLFFQNIKKDPGMLDCAKVFKVERLMPKTANIASSAIESLLFGPDESEADAGYASAINFGVKINSLEIIDGVAKIDFDKKLKEGVGGSCRVIAIRSQITETLKQFDNINEVEISIDGRIDDILQP